MIEQAIQKLLQERCTPAVVRAIEQGGDAAPLWAEIEASGFLDLLVSEEAGGAGLPLAELFPILCAFGAHAVPLPMAQTIVARALIGPAAQGRVTIAPALLRGAGGALQCPLVPMGLVADRVLAAEGRRLWLLPAERAQRRPTGVHGSLTASLDWSDAGAAVEVPGDGSVLQAYGAAVHAALLAGAMSRVLQMSLTYCNDREQFGRPIGKFQAVQHQLAVMAEQVVAASVAAEVAFAGDGERGDIAHAPTLLTAAIAKARTSEAATQVAAIAHAVHGAIGITDEYDLQLFTRRLHEWRIAHGSELYWQRIVGDAFFAQNGSLAEFVRLG